MRSRIPRIGLTANGAPLRENLRERFEQRERAFDRFSGVKDRLRDRGFGEFVRARTPRTVAARDRIIL